MVVRHFSLSLLPMRFNLHYRFFSSVVSVLTDHSKFYQLILGISLFAVTFLACTAPTSLSPDPGYDFYPLEKGRYVEYDVIETSYSLVGLSITKTYQLKEVLRSSFTDLTNQEAFRLERFRRENATQSWRLDSVWTVKQMADQLVRTENNISYIKLSYPARKGNKWNGNALNSLGKDDYEMDAADKSYRFNEKQYDNVLTVKQQDDSTLVSQDRRIERFAKEIGLVYKESTILFLCAQPGCVGQGKIDYGSRKIQMIRAYGKE